MIFFIISIQKISANRLNHQNIDIQPLATSSSNNPNFGPPTNISIGTNPFSVSKGDFNNDGITDLVTPNFNANNISIFIGNSSGTFNTPTNLPTGASPRQVTIGDFNSDGLEDLVVVNRNSTFVSFFQGSPSVPGVFTGPTNIATNAAGISIDSADFNLDGNRDLVVATIAGSVSVFMGNGLGSFSLTPTIFTPLAQPNFVIFADVNNDLKLDIVTSSRAGSVSALLGNGTGGLIGPALNTLTGLDSATVTVGDLNQDGKTDLVTANLTNASSSILIGDGTGNFTVTNITTGANPTQVAIADLNLDGKQDLAITNSIPNTVSVFAGNGNGTFAAAVNFSVGTTPNSIITDDINKDGKVDLIVSNQNSNNLSLLSNITSVVVAALQFTTTNFPAGVSPFFGELADFNKDGNLDIVVANSDSSNVVNSISILLGTSTGFGPATSFPVAGSAVNGVTAGDFNKDGNLDVAVAARFSNNVAVLFGDGTGSFGASTSFFSGAGPREISSADLNKDGNLDLVVPNIFDNTISVLINNSMGSFASPLTLPTQNNPNFVAINDLNKDGNLDLVASNENSASISVFLADGKGSFGRAASFAVGTTPGHVILRDINSDGNVDAITANFSGTVSVLLGNGLGSFAPTIDFPAGSSPGESVLTDINNDGKLDLLVPNQLTSTVTILLGDGLGNFTLTSSVSVGTGPLEVFAADFNFDGCVDFVTANTGGANITLALQTGCPSISILPAALPNLTFNINYSQQLTATPTGSYAFSLVSGNLPIGLSLSRTGLISGIATSQGTFTFTVQAIDNNQCTGRRTYTLTVGANTGAGRIGFSVNSFTVTEGSIATITVVRTNGGVGTVSVNYSTVNGTARSGVDYVNSAGTITFGNGDMSPKTFTVQTLPDNVSESNKTILLSLGNPTGGAELNLTTATLNVIEKDAPRPGRFAFSQTAYSVNETGGAVTINVNRLDGGNISASVNFSTSAGANARAGSNYMETSGTLTFAPGSVSQSFNIPIFNDRQPGQDKIVNLRLSEATNGAIISGGTASLTIIESTPPVPPAVLQTVNRVEFDSVNIGEMATRTITIRNVGGQDLTFNNPDISGNDITLLTPPRTTRLTANESTSFEVQFSPKPGSLGDVTGNITISSNAGITRIPVTARSIDMIAPSVKFTAPMGGELLRAGGQLRIRYDAEDNDALSDFTVSFIATTSSTSKSINPNATGASSGDIGRLDNTFREVIWNIPGDLSSSTVRIMIREQEIEQEI
ncbi:MAG: VCBS repeat-containing protein [Blastocatellia bacterium]|nr:VCBS repeat-containing protein [Blastocatellia bacterium]